MDPSSSATIRTPSRLRELGARGEVCIRTNWLERKVCDGWFGDISWWRIAQCHSTVTTRLLRRVIGCLARGLLETVVRPRRYPPVVD